jgi:hypothetical protein
MSQNYIDAMKQAIETLISNQYLLEIEVNKAVERDAADAWIREKEAELRQHKASITALGHAIEQAEKQEPVAWGMRDMNGTIYDCISPQEHAREEGSYTVPLYTAPPQRQPLTDEEIMRPQRNSAQ